MQKQPCRFSCIHYQDKKGKVSAASFTLAQWTTMESSSMTVAVTLTGNNTPTSEEHRASLADVWHSIPSPSHWDLGSPGFLIGTASTPILLCGEPALHAGREHSGSVGWSRET